MVININIYTGYYAKCATYAAKGLTLVSISKSMPKHAKIYVHEEIEELMPHWSMLKISKEKYVPMYNRILAKCNPRTIVKKLKALAKEQKLEGVVLLCWEKPSDFCHRHIVGRWLKKYTGIKVREYSTREDKKIYVDIDNLKDE